MSVTDVIAAVLQFRESKRRDEELELLRQQVQGKQEDRRRHERALRGECPRAEEALAVPMPGRARISGR
jgi:hypothetical protein